MSPAGRAFAVWFVILTVTALFIRWLGPPTRRAAFAIGMVALVLAPLIAARLRPQLPYNSLRG